MRRCCLLPGISQFKLRWIHTPRRQVHQLLFSKLVNSRYRGHQLTRSARASGRRTCDGFDLRAGEEDSSGGEVTAEAQLGTGSHLERGTTSARNCGINPGADWGWKHWTTGGTDGFGRGHVRDSRCASRWRAAGSGACKPFSLPRGSTKCLSNPTSSFWPHP